MSPVRKQIPRREELNLINTSGVDGFDLEAEHDGLNLFGFSCDEKDGPISVCFHPEIKKYEINLSVLRRLLDDAEAELLERRRDFQFMAPFENGTL
jgi:hypothetical protein